MNILEQIIANKRKEVEQLKQFSTKHFEQSVYFEKPIFSLKRKMQKNTGVNIIAEFKRQSPSKGIINNTSKIEEVVNAYSKNGAAAISILTDTNYFGGTNQDILNVRPQVATPLLRKEFIIDEIQLLEAKSIGADVVLLIAACLTPKAVKNLATFAKQLGLEVLLEIHDEAEFEHFNHSVDFVGVNNRNLKDFAVNLEHSTALCKKIDNQFIKVAESGIATVEDVKLLQQEGFNAFLIGELFMKTNQPGTTMQHFLNNCNNAN